MSNHIGAVRIPFDALRAFLRMPDDAKIRGVQSGHLYDAIDLQVEHPSLPEVEPGAPVPLVRMLVQNVPIPCFAGFAPMTAPPPVPVAMPAECPASPPHPESPPPILP